MFLDIFPDTLKEGRHSLPVISEKTGASVRTVKRYIKEFQEGNVLKREGSDTNGSDAARSKAGDVAEQDLKRKMMRTKEKSGMAGRII